MLPQRNSLRFGNRPILKKKRPGLAALVSRNKSPGSPALTSRNKSLGAWVLASFTRLARFFGPPAQRNISGMGAVRLKELKVRASTVAALQNIMAGYMTGVE